MKKLATAAFVILAAFTLACLALLPGCSWFEQHPNVAPATEQCAACVGADVVNNYSLTPPLPFFPQLCDKMLSDCSATCGADLVTIIQAVADTSDPKVAATPAYQEARARRAAMLSPDAGK